MRFQKKLVVGAFLAAVSVGLAAGPALAQDCFIANRSDTGSLQAGTHSSRWAAFTVTGDFLGLPPGTCATDINNALTAAGLPTVFASRTDKVLLANLPTSRDALLANAKGVEHFDDSPILNSVVNVVIDVASSDPACA